LPYIVTEKGIIDLKIVAIRFSPDQIGFDIIRRIRGGETDAARHNDEKQANDRHDLYNISDVVQKRGGFLSVLTHSIPP